MKNIWSTLVRQQSVHPLVSCTRSWGFGDTFHYLIPPEFWLKGWTFTFAWMKFVLPSHPQPKYIRGARCCFVWFSTNHSSSPGYCLHISACSFLQIPLCILPAFFVCIRHYMCISASLGCISTYSMVMSSPHSKKWSGWIMTIRVSCFWWSKRLITKLLLRNQVRQIQQVKKEII